MAKTSDKPDQLTLIKEMMDACGSNSSSSRSLRKIHCLVSKHPSLAYLQHPDTGISPLMIAASHGDMELCRFLLSNGAPWNAIDKHGKCAGNYAVDSNAQNCIDLLVDHGVQSELILGAVSSSSGLPSSRPQPATDVSEEPCTKPSFLSQNLDFRSRSLVDEDGDAVMMEWERPLMSAHASVITSDAKGKRLLNVGFGMGIIDSILQETYRPAMHVIIEAHPKVYEKMIRDGWDKKTGVRIFFGTWQDVMPTLISEGIHFDGIFFDTYAESGSDFQLWHTYTKEVLEKDHGIYSFFNGFCPDNIFFQGVACQVFKLQLNQLGLNVEFYPCEITVNDEEWNNVRRKYWHDNTYYLPVVTWNKTEVDKNS